MQDNAKEGQDQKKVWKEGSEKVGHSIQSDVKVHETMSASSFDGCYFRKNMKVKLLEQVLFDVCQEKCAQSGHDRFSYSPQSNACECVKAKQNKRFNLSLLQFQSNNCDCMAQTTSSQSMCVYHSKTKSLKIKQIEAKHEPKAIESETLTTTQDSAIIKSKREAIDESECADGISQTSEVLGGVTGHQCYWNTNCCPGDHCCRQDCLDHRDSNKCEPIKQVSYNFFIKKTNLQCSMESTVNMIMLAQTAIDALLFTSTKMIMIGCSLWKVENIFAQILIVITCVVKCVIITTQLQ